MQQVPLNLDSFDEEFIKNLKVLPREVKKLGGRDGLKSAWIFKTSAFRLYKPDSKELLEKCFLNDWSYIEQKIEYIIKDPGEREKVKMIFKTNYRYLRGAYKYTAGLDAVGNFVSIGANSFTSLMQSVG